MSLDPYTTRRHAEELAARFPPLLVAAEHVAATVARGTHGRRRVGPGEAFWQFRRYQSGDSMRTIDWRQSAKSDPLFVREMECEAAESVWLWRDVSPSMRYRSDRLLPEKGERADLLLLALASLLQRGGERTALVGSGQAPSNGREALTRIAEQMAHPASPEEDTEAGGLPVFEPLPRHARIVLIGDFLIPLARLDAVVRAFAARGVHGHLLQVLDPAEETLPFSGRVRFEGLEDEGEVLVNRVESLRPDYAARVEAHKNALHDLAAAVGWSFARHHTGRPPQTAVLALYEALTAPPVTSSSLRQPLSRGLAPRDNGPRNMRFRYR